MDEIDKEIKDMLQSDVNMEDAELCSLTEQITSNKNENISPNYAIINIYNKAKQTHDNESPAFTKVVMGSICEEGHKEVSRKGKIIKVLIDTGCSLTLLQRSVISTHLYVTTKEKYKTLWSTNTGAFNTTY